MTDRQASLVASLTEIPSADAGQGEDFEDVWAIEWRADLLGDPRPDNSKVLENARTIYTLRSRFEGGSGPDSPAERAGRLRAAAASHDLVDLEADRDLAPELLEAVAPRQRILSWHGPAASLGDLRRRFEAMAETPARFYKLVPSAQAPSDGIEPLALLDELGREDVIAFCSGESGAWTRLLAPRLGAPVVFGQAAGEPAAPGQLSLARLRADYGLPRLGAVSKLYGIAGRPALHSLSPRLHNLMFRKHGLDRLYVPFHVPIFGDFWLDLVETDRLDALGFELCGLSVTAPFKEIAIAIAGAVSPRAELVGAANTLVKRDRVWEAECTDPDGVVAPLVARGLRLESLDAAVVGAGGAGRAAMEGLTERGARVTLVNRSRRRGRRVAAEQGVAFESLADFEPGRYDLLVNATPLGAGESSLPFDPGALRSSAVVVDLAYSADGETALVEATRANGHLAIDGREVLLYQAETQFEWTHGRDFDLDLGRDALGLPALSEVADAMTALRAKLHVREFVADTLTPVSVYERLAALSPVRFLFESVTGGEQVSRYSFLGAGPRALVRVGADGLEVEQGGEVRPLPGEPLVELERLLSKIAGDRSTRRDLPFTGGYVGFFGFDTIRLAERLPARPADAFGLPIAILGRFDHLIVFDHASQRVLAIANEIEGEVSRQEAERDLAALTEILESRYSTGASPLPDTTDPVVEEAAPSLSDAEYRAAVASAREYIAAGDIFQVVLARHFRLRRRGLSPRALYQALRVVNPSPYMVLLELPEVALVGASPEMLVRKIASRIETRPIAGTRRRGASAVEDRALADELIADKKERAEHVMLVDLGRNDVGRVAIPGTVRVSTFMEVERYSHVMHIVSNVEGEVDEATTPLQALLSCFPAGTVSGAPKIRAIEIIDELEPEARGPYAGAVGYISFSGDLDTCITIRTLVILDDEISVTAGAGIVADSDPASEERETRHKAAALLSAVDLAGRLDPRK